MGMSIYLNASSHGLPSSATIKRMRLHLDMEDRLGAIAAQAEAESELAGIRHAAAALIGADTDTVGFSSTTSMAWLSIVTNLQIARKRLLVAPHEWGANIVVLENLARNADAKVEVLPELDLEAPDLEPWRAAIDEDVAAIFAPMVTSIEGLRYPIEEIGALPRPETCKFIIDAAQTLGQTPIDVAALRCDALAATCRKWLRAPRTTALFWMSPSSIVDGPIETFEPFDTNIALRLGLGAAIEEASRISIPRIEQQIRALTDQALVRARALDLDTLNGTGVQTGTITLGIPSSLSARLQKAVADEGIQVKWPSPARDEPHAPRAANDLEAMRISPHINNTTEQIDALFDVVETCIRSR